MELRRCDLLFKSDLAGDALSINVFVSEELESPYNIEQEASSMILCHVATGLLS